MMFFSRKQRNSEIKNSVKKEVDSEDFAFIGKVLLVVDGSGPSRDASNFAVDFARQLKCKLDAAFVVDTAILDYLQQMRIFVKEERLELEQDLELKGKRYLSAVQELGEKYNIPVQTHICQGRFHQTILSLAKELEVDLLIIGGWKHEIKQKNTSSVERQLVMDLAECPVIVVKKSTTRD